MFNYKCVTQGVSPEKALGSAGEPQRPRGKSNQVGGSYWREDFLIEMKKEALRWTVLMFGKC